MLVGAIGRGGEGAAYVFRWNDSELEWVEEQILTGSDTTSGDRFGSRVTHKGDVAVVTGGIYPIASSSFEDSGVAYVFRWDEEDEEWVEEQILTSDEESDRFGASLATSGDLVVVGAEGDDDLGSNAGAVYVFRWSEDEEEWLEEQKLTASDGDDDGRFGSAVSISGTSIVVGASSVNFTDDQVGSAYVFQYQADDGEWLEQRRLVPSDVEDDEDNLFGVSVAVSGDVAFIGAPIDDALGYIHGSVYIYDSRLRPFFRGDVNGNGEVFGLLDAIYLLQWQFSLGDDPPCMDAADVDDSGSVSAIVDALALLLWTFADGDVPPDPGPEECGSDPSGNSDGLQCLTPQTDCL